MRQQRRPLPELAVDVPAEGRDLVDDALRLRAPTIERHETQLPAAPSEGRGAAALVTEIADLRLRFEAAQAQVLDALRDLRCENERLAAENRRFRTLVREYEQVLARR